MVMAGKPSLNVIQNYHPPARKNQQEQGGEADHVRIQPRVPWDNDTRPPLRAEVIWLRWRRLLSKVMYRLGCGGDAYWWQPPEDPSSESFEMLDDPGLPVAAAGKGR